MLSLSGSKTGGDSIEVEYHGKRGYRFALDGETTAGAGVGSFRYSALA